MSTEANMIQGYLPVLFSNGVEWAVKSVKPEISRTTQNSRTTADGIYRTVAVDSEGFSLDVEAFRYYGTNPHDVAVFSIIYSGVYYTPVIYYPEGRISNALVVIQSYRATTFCWESYSESFDAGSGFLTLHARGVSSGLFKRPGQS